MTLSERVSKRIDELSKENSALCSKVRNNNLDASDPETKRLEELGLLLKEYIYMLSS